MRIIPLLLNSALSPIVGRSPKPWLEHCSKTPDRMEGDRLLLLLQQQLLLYRVTRTREARSRARRNSKTLAVVFLTHEAVAVIEPGSFPHKEKREKKSLE